MAEVEEVVADDVTDGEDFHLGVPDGQEVAGPGAVLGDRGVVQHGHVVQLRGRVVPEEDEQAMAEERLDLAAHLRHLRLPDDLRVGGAHASSTSSGLTPETKSSSVMNWASGPAGDVAWTSTVFTFFMG